MTLNILDPLTKNGTAGTSGTPGSSGTSVNPNGTIGGSGTAGDAITLNVRNQTFLGDAGGDTITFDREATGGGGGGGGFGGSGAASDATVVQSSGAGFTQTDVTYDAAGLAGSGGFGGLGGNATVRYANLTFTLGQAIGTQNTVRLTAETNGGHSGAGGAGGSGGSSGTTNTSTASIIGPPPFTTIYSQLGGPGMQGADGSSGGSGSDARTLFSTLGISGDALNLLISGSAFGGAGGSGGAGGRGGSGATGGAGGDGGNGGAGGEGLASVAGLTVNGTAGMAVQITLAAHGGAGANGAAGAAGGTGTVANATSNSGGSSSQTTITHAGSGAGGSGGDGGLASAVLRDSVLTGSAAADSVYVGLSARGGLAGDGASGGPSAASSVTSSGTNVTTVTGVPSGTSGADGIDGASRVEMRNVSVSLGGGDDIITLSFVADGQGSRTVIFAGNSLTGGLGDDTLRLGAGLLGEQACVVDVQAGTLRIGTGAVNTISGFKSYGGSSGNDRFIDGTGNHRYNGSFGADTFVFTSGRAGTDTITGLAAEDVIALRGFGGPLNSFADVLANTADTASGALIQTSATSFVLLSGVMKAALLADDFTF